MSRLHDAILWAAALHQGQDREGPAPLPYITHPLEVLTSLRDIADCRDEDILVAAVLHDVLEETEARPAEIAARFGPRVAGLVRELTRREPTEAETQGMTPDEIYELRTGIMLEEIRAMSPEAQLIKLADRWCNLQEAERVRRGAKKKRYRRQTRQILELIPRTVQPALWDRIAKLAQS